MLSKARTDVRRVMGWAALLGGTLVLLYWAAFLSGLLDMGQHDPVIGTFESAFPIADTLFCLVLFAASHSLFKRKRSGPFLLTWAGAISLYLGLVDLTFYAAQGHYSSLTAVAGMELALNLICISAGAAALFAAWRLSHDHAAADQGLPTVSGSVVLVTGAASGIGAATARELAHAGATLALADIRVRPLERLREELTRTGASAIAFPVDVADFDSVTELVDGALMAFGRVDALVNCAGTLCPGAPDRVPIASLRRQVETNLMGTIYTTRALLPYFRRRRHGGHLVHIASLGGIVPLPGEATYCATKFAVRGFCQSLALELRGTRVRVSVIQPDSTNTPQLRTEALYDGSALSFTSRPLEAEDVARAIISVLEHPRPEISIPKLRGLLAQLAAVAPSLMRMVYPLLDRQGRRGLARFRARHAGGAVEHPISRGA